MFEIKQYSDSVKTQREPRQHTGDSTPEDWWMRLTWKGSTLFGPPGNIFRGVVTARLTVFISSDGTLFRGKIGNAPPH